jgi:hypothetical protein
MPLPIFPIEAGSPGDGSLIAIHGGGPASTEVLGGVIHLAQAVEAYPVTGANIPVTGGRQDGEPLGTDGVTIWIKGSLSVDLCGEPAVTDYADMLARWTTVRDKLRLANYELFLYYRTDAPATYRKYKTVNTVLLRCYWNNPVCLSYTLAAFTTDKTLYTTAPGA